MKKTDKFIIGTIVGGAVGSILGLLFAPKKGADTRKDISHASKKAVKWGKDKSDEYSDELDEVVERLENSAKRIKGSFRSLKKTKPVKRLVKSRTEESTSE